MHLKNPFDSPGSWFKANFHTHTTTSDGDTVLAERVKEYQNRGYGILAITDHGKTNDVTGLSAEGFLVISGVETHPLCPGGDPYHFVCINVPHPFDVESEPDPNARIRMVREAGGEVIIGHPYWCGHNLTHLLPIEDAVAVEVYNATCTKIGKGFSSVHWDDMLDAGRLLPAVAVDDVHRGRDKFMGWTMVRVENLSVDAVMDALRTGCYYASCGPTIEYAGVVDDKVIVRCSPVAEIHCIAQRSTGRSVYADGRPLLTEWEFPLNGKWRYVRIEVVDEVGRHAWTNPLVWIDAQ